jgi:hypothetical protein
MNITSHAHDNKTNTADDAGGDDEDCDTRIKTASHR